ncbi:MAG: 4-alpha-glucanotransferase [Spirochaetia bacterium]|jgi:4-alpha-glucanotransferase|nr:4-alpha-glucanotransferase [Spirochaetia bacterium]
MKQINTGMRSTGFALPLLSLNTAEAACGEFPDILRMAALAQSWGMNLLQILPVNDTGFETSPYSALSAFALNPIYLRITELPELNTAAVKDGISGKKPASPTAFIDDSEPALRDIISRTVERAEALVCNATQWAEQEGGVPYERILEEKLSILESLWNFLFSSQRAREIHGELDRWVDSRTWSKAYTCFVELKRRNSRKPWWEWSENQNPDEAAIQRLWNDPAFARSLRFHAWIQMRAEEQFSKACREAAGLGVDVMGDIPILLNMDSAEVWQSRQLFDLEYIAGAPPDMYSQLGQNWGFPLYRWDLLEKQDYSFWKERLRSADQFYSLFRIDHVLGFFRIWAVDAHEADGFLGHFRPEYPILYHELDALGFDTGRIRWLSKPHVSESFFAEAFEGLPSELANKISETLFQRIDNEPLFLFSPQVRGGKDIVSSVRAILQGSAAGQNASAVFQKAADRCSERLLAAWRDRTLLEISSGHYVPAWEFRTTKAWKSLGEEERQKLEGLLLLRRSESMALWERNGAKILKNLIDSVQMQACAEDLGAVPPCVPAVLSRLGIPGLRVLRWHRAWDKEGAPYIALAEYPEDSVACISVHDSSNLRQWWEEEADRQALWDMLGPKTAANPAPPSLSAEDAYALLRGFSAVNSRILVHPLQDLLAAHERFREANPAKERINVPGTTGGSNWRYRMKPRLEALLEDAEFAGFMNGLAALRR